MTMLAGKKALIVGLASQRSIAYGIAQSFAAQGAELAFTYQGDKLKDRVTKMAAEWGSELCFPCDVSDDKQIEDVFINLKEHWDGLDIIVHSVAYAPQDQLAGDYVDCLNREGFRIAQDISAYSLGALAKAGLPMMEGRNGSIVTLSYLGAERALPNYNVMGVAKASLEANMRYLAQSLGPRGIRCNAISAGPIRTLAAAGIKSFRKMLDYNASVTPLRSNVTIEQVGDTASFLCSEMASGITGEVVHVDGGFHAVALSLPE
jgi:enoyl-[acyl-carrier protein] reductase I